MTDLPTYKNQCEFDGHVWEEGYYGYFCTRCPAFISYGCEPWAPEESYYATDDYGEILDEDY